MLNEEPTCEERQPFAKWLLRQRDRGPLFDMLPEYAHTDRGFPHTGSPDDVRRRLAGGSAGGDMFDLIDGLETDWLAM